MLVVRLIIGSEIGEAGKTFILSQTREVEEEDRLLIYCQHIVNKVWA